MNSKQANFSVSFIMYMICALLSISKQCIAGKILNDKVDVDVYIHYVANSVVIYTFHQQVGDSRLHDCH